MENIVVIERDGQAPLALVYPNGAEAAWALNDSLLVEDLCQTDCIDCYMDAVIPEGAEAIIAPTRAEETADLAA